MKKIKYIKETKGHHQFQRFIEILNSSPDSDGTKNIPVIVPGTFDESVMNDIVIPDEADFGVCSSGTKGKPKLYFRTINSWKGFFPEQNRVFNIDSNSRIFINGSLAFTGNLNIAFEAYCTECFLHCSDGLRAQSWAEDIYSKEINTIYMIPDKLLHLAKTGNVFPKVKSVLCGSQFVTKEQYIKIQNTFPEAKVFLYYGASETNYISYKILSDTSNFNPDNIGKIFNTVEVETDSENHIKIKSDWCVCGIKGLYDTKDVGYIKDGNLYLKGRADDVINIHGEKLNKSEIERLLLSVEGIEECSVQINNGNHDEQILTAHIAGKNLPEKIPVSVFKEIPPVFIPKKYIHHEKLPRNESGKIAI